MTDGPSYTGPLDDDPADEFDGPSYDQILAASTPRRRVLAGADGRPRAWPIVVPLAVALLGAAALAWSVFAPERERSVVVGTGPALSVSLTPETRSPSPSPSPSGLRPDPNPPEPVFMRGSGNLTFNVRTPDTGLTLLRVRVDRGKFTLTEVDEFDIRKFTVAVGTGPHDGIDLNAGDGELHRWRMEATGSWTVELTSARGAPVRRAPFSGNGDAVFWYVGTAGIAEVTSGARGAGEWVRVQTYDADSRRSPVALLTEKGTERVRWPAGPVLVLVRAEAPWRIAVRAV